MEFEFPREHFRQHYLLYFIIVGLGLKNKIKESKRYFTCTFLYSLALSILMSPVFSYIKMSVVNYYISQGNEITVIGTVVKINRYNGSDKILIGDKQISIPYYDVLCKHGRGLVKINETVSISIIKLDTIPFALEGKCITKLEHL